MKYTEANLRSIINSSSRYREFGVPSRSANGMTVFFYDEAHFAACAEMIAKFEGDTAYVLFNTQEHPKALSERLGARILAFPYAIGLVHRDVVICTDNVEIPKMMRVVMATWRAGRNCYTITRFGLPKPRPFLLEERKDDILKVVNSLSDEESVKSYARRIKSFIMGHPGYHDIAPYYQYWHPHVHIEKGDVVVDAGIGSSAHASVRFAEIAGPSGKVFAFEPIKSMSNRLRPECDGVSNLELLPMGLWSPEEDVEMFVAGDISTFRSLGYTQGAATETCQLVSVDKYFPTRKTTPSLIKMDIEGAETKALIGAQETIRRFKPKLQICLYHTIVDFIDIPLLVLSYNPNYKLFVGHHTPFFNEFVLYAVDPDARRGEVATNIFSRIGRSAPKRRRG